ncbi:MAG TPA: HNH endonuclease [Trueperaceae bacterium]|nr:HNH endonuclease [Trueperaceae bacterium]
MRRLLYSATTPHLEGPTATHVDHPTAAVHGAEAKPEGSLGAHTAADLSAGAGVGEVRPLENINAARVLILNASYEPLHVCSVKRAVALLMHEVAERVEDSGMVLRSPSSLFPVPSVIKLRRFVRGPFRQRVAFNRKNVFRRDDHTCQYCAKHTFDLTLDHVMPRSRGGPTTWDNVVACCKPCNAKKRDRTPDEAHLHLLRKPFAPRFMFSSAYGVMPDIDPIWERYLPAHRGTP